LASVDLTSGKMDIYPNKMFFPVENEENIAPKSSRVDLASPLKSLKIEEAQAVISLVTPSPRKINMEKMESCEQKYRSRSPIKRQQDGNKIEL
jgi:hypothetical protein